MRRGWSNRDAGWKKRLMTIQCTSKLSKSKYELLFKWWNYHSWEKKSWSIFCIYISMNTLTMSVHLPKVLVLKVHEYKGVGLADTMKRWGGREQKSSEIFFFSNHAFKLFCYDAEYLKLHSLQHKGQCHGSICLCWGFSMKTGASCYPEMTSGYYKATIP